MEDQGFMTTEEVVDYLQIGLRTVYRLIELGRLPAFRVGQQWRFRKKDLDAWLAANRPRGASETPLPRARVLVVDDDEGVRTYLAKALPKEKYEIETAEDGLKAVERLRAQEFDLLITDLRMPGMNGLGVIRAAKQQWPRIAMLVVTGNSTEASAIEAMNSGATGYLTKPFSLEAILRTVSRVLGEPGAEVEAH